MGDNLKAASQFVNESKRTLDTLMSAPSLNSPVAIDQLAELQRGAKIMHARSIYRAAQTAVDMLHKGRPLETVQFELGVVSGLVEQYASGLDEVLSETDRSVIQINSEFAKKSTPQPMPVRDMIADLDMQLSESLFDVPQIIEQNNDALDAEIAQVVAPLKAPLRAASAQLTPLIQYAPEAEQRGALAKLSQLYPVEQAVDKAKPEQSTHRSASVEFESLMPELTNIVLTTARHANKTVSISYAANGIRLGAKMADKLRLALIDTCELLINRSLEAADVRRARGESGAGHITIIASLATGKIDVELECTGRTVPLSECKSLNCQDLLESGGQMVAEQHGDRFRVSLIKMPTYARDNLVAGEAPVILGHAS